MEALIRKGIKYESSDAIGKEELAVYRENLCCAAG